MLARDELYFFASHCLSGFLDARAGRNKNIRAEPETKMVRMFRFDVIEDRLGRTPEFDHHLRSGNGQSLPGTNVKRHAGPPPGLDMQAHGSERLNLRVRSDPVFITISAVLAPYYVCRG